MRRVGGTRQLPIDVRIIAATHVDLAARAKTGEFREDLYYRLNVVSIELPRLSARREDILPLARHFLARFAAQYRLPVPRLDERAGAVLHEPPLDGERPRAAERDGARAHPQPHRRARAG